MRLHVIPELCQGHVQCKFTAPELIELDDYGNAHAAHDVVPSGSEDLARLAAASCPEQAIRLEE
jgi:ferredoxin